MQNQKEWRRFSIISKSRLQYHKFLSPYQESCNTKSFSSLHILTNQGVSNQYLNCYISALVHLLLGTTTCAMLPNLLENDSVLNNNAHYLKNKLHSEGSSTYNFTQCDRKCSSLKVPVLGQILEEVMQQKYQEKEMIDSGEFIFQLLDRIIADGIVENPFETLLADLNQCAACGYTKGITDKRKYIEAKIWNTDRSNAIRLQSLIYSIFFVT